MPIISVQTNITLDNQQQEQLLTTVTDATSEALATDKTRIDVVLQILQPQVAMIGGVHQRPYVRFSVEMLAGRTRETKQNLVKRYYDVAQNITPGTEPDVKTIIRDLQRSDLALGDTLLE